MTLVETKAAIFDLNVKLEENTQQVNQLQVQRNNIQIELVILQRQLNSIPVETPT